MSKVTLWPLKIKSPSCLDMSVSDIVSMQCHITKEQNPEQHHCKNLKTCENHYSIVVVRWQWQAKTLTTQAAVYQGNTKFFFQLEITHFVSTRVNRWSVWNSLHLPIHTCSTFHMGQANSGTLGLHLDNMKFNSQDEEWIKICRIICIIVPVYLPLHNVQDDDDDRKNAQNYKSQPRLQCHDF